MKKCLLLLVNCMVALPHYRILWLSLALSTEAFSFQSDLKRWSLRHF